MFLKFTLIVFVIEWRIKSPSGLSVLPATATVLSVSLRTNFYELLQLKYKIKF